MQIKESVAAPVKLSLEPEVVLLDGDDFYGLVLDMVLFNLRHSSSRKISGFGGAQQLIAGLQTNPKEKIIVIDEFFIPVEADMKKLVETLKAANPKGKLIVFTVSKPEEIANQNLYDYMVVKSSRSNEQTLIKALSECLGVEFVMNNNEPERE